LASCLLISGLMNIVFSCLVQFCGLGLLSEPALGAFRP